MARLVAKDGGDILVGTSGDDILVAGDTNTSQPDHILSNGMDYLTGGAGADVFDFTALNADGSNKATSAFITDFQVGVDKLMIEDLKGGHDTFHDLHFSVMIGGLDPMIVETVFDAGHDRIVLVGVSYNDLTANDFIFSATAAVPLHHLH